MGDAPTAHLFSIYTSGAVRFLWLGGLAAGMYSGLTYGLKETCGTHDWVIYTQAVAGLVADGRQIVARANSEATNYGRVCGQASHLEQMPGGSEGSKDSSWRKEKLGFPKHFAIPQSKEGASGWSYQLHL